MVMTARPITSALPTFLACAHADWSLRSEWTIHRPAIEAATATASDAPNSHGS
jgi:hypothetical protein